MDLDFALIKFFLWHQYLQKAIPTSKTLFASKMLLAFLLLVVSAGNLVFLQNAYSQVEPSPDTLTGNSESANITARTLDNGNNTTNVTSISNGNASEDFRTLREQYLSSWEGLRFSSSFDTFLADCFIPPQGYGAYNLRASNIFGTDETICLYVEPVGFGYKEFIDQQGNPLYAYNITTNVTVSDRQGNPMGSFDISFQPENSYRKVTELFLVVEIRQFETPIPVGEYTATYHFTDGVKGESFDLVKDFRIGEIAEVR